MMPYTPALVALCGLSALVALLGALLWSRTREAAPGRPARPALTPARYEALLWASFSGIALGAIGIGASATRIILDALAVLP